MAGYVAGGKFRPGLSGSVGYTTADRLRSRVLLGIKLLSDRRLLFRFDLGWTWAVTDDKKQRRFGVVGAGWQHTRAAPPKLSTNRGGCFLTAGYWLGPPLQPTC